MFGHRRLSQEMMTQPPPVLSASPTGLRMQAVLPPRTPWDPHPLMHAGVPCVVKLESPRRQKSQTQPHLEQKRLPTGEMHLQLPAPSRGASGQGRQRICRPACGTWQPCPQHQLLRPSPTCPQFLSCLIRQPLCTTRLQRHLPQPPWAQPPVGQPGAAGTPSSLSPGTWRS